MLVSNMVIGMFQRLWPNSDHNKVNRMEARLEEHDQTIQSFYQEFNLTREVTQGMMETLSNINERQYDQEHQIQQLIGLLPRVSWSSSYLQSRITAASADLQLIIDRYTHGGHVASRQLANMFNIESLRNVDESDTRFVQLERLRENVIRMQFIVRQRSKDTAVYKVGAFKFWDNLTETPALKEYRGHRFLIYNRTSNCLKAIDEPSQLAVIEECDQANFTDSRLAGYPLLRMRFEAIQSQGQQE